MKVQPDTTSYTVEALKVIETFGSGDDITDTVKLIKNVSDEDAVYFLVVHEPPWGELTGPEDIETVEKFKVLPYENRFAVRQEAREEARQYYNELND
ncbi:MAG: hypothetical protein J07AB43_02350 [Candidatus Nanosalina sp. J07AB43]|jgi:hypothetical protein|nr:MAG: hypothetical protein J07AB43_02350 [Candidatus Nanosalina sp. J07AB43]